MNSFQNYFTGTEPCGKLPVIRPKYQTQRFALSKRLTLYDEIYIGHTL
jgi:hypothetical protein